MLFPDLVLNNKVYNDKTVANLITVITTTNPIPSIPTTKIIYPSQKSLFQVPALRLCKKIIVFDGIQPEFVSRREDYEEYKQNVLNLTKTDPYFENTQLVECSSWANLSGAIEEALKHVTTPFIFIHQHDFLLLKNFDLNGLIATMSINPNIKHVRLAAGDTNMSFSWYDGFVDEEIEGPSHVPLCRTFGWSDNDHVTTLDYYLNFVLPKCEMTAMENVLNEELCQAVQKDGYGAQKPFGTYLYGNLNDGRYIKHIYGRDTL